MIQYTYTSNSIPLHYTPQLSQINQINQQPPEPSQINCDQPTMGLDNSNNNEAMNNFNINTSLTGSQHQAPPQVQHQQFIFDPLTNDANANIADFPGFQNYINGTVVSQVNQNTIPDTHGVDINIINKQDLKIDVSNRSLVSKCKGTSKHFFKLENKIALLREVCTFNPFEDSSRWKQVSEKYNIWTYHHQPERLYAAIDYLPRKVREMLGNYKQALKNRNTDQQIKSELSSTLDGKNDNENNISSSSVLSPLDIPKKNSISNNLESNNDEVENQELNQLLKIAYQMLNIAEKNKKNSSKKAKMDSPKSNSEKSTSRKGSFQKKNLGYQKNSENSFENNPYQTNIISNIEVPQSSMQSAPFQESQQQQVNTDIGSLKRRYSSLDNTAVGYEELQKILNPLIQKIQILETKVLMLENTNRNLRNVPVNVMQVTQDFQPGISNALTSLPILQTSLDIEHLTTEQLNTYLSYYNLGFFYQSNSEKKKRLTQFLGIVGNENYSN